VKKYLTIGEMAKIHCISRQTLIYYDKIGLFKPIYTDENSYRYYSLNQIPSLREICFLKSLGINLKNIKNQIQNRNLSNAISLFRRQEKNVNQKIEKLIQMRNAIYNRLQIYADAISPKDNLYKPIIKKIPERKVAFQSFQNKISREELHLTTMKLLNENKSLIAGNFGTIIRESQLDKKNLFEGAGIYITFPASDVEITNAFILPEGEYACMYKYAMPYETTYLEGLIKWVKTNNYRICGNVVDSCLLDTTFYKDDKSVDFCELQIPVKKEQS
jgi:DNA-binding transcriptional MerR regulator